MIGFFRRTRKKLADDNQFLKYSRYAIGEIVLVVIGILIALQINTWNNTLQNKKVKNNYLERIRVDLAKDVSTLNHLRSSHKTRYSSADIVLNLVNSDMKLENVRKILKHYLNMWVHDPFAANDNTFKELINSGNLDLISNSDLKFKLLELHALYEKIKAKEAHIEIDNRNYIWNPSTTYVDFKTYSSNRIQPEKLYDFFTKMYKEHIILNGLFMYRTNHPELDGLYSESLAKNVVIDSLIILELKGN